MNDDDDAMTAADESLFAALDKHRKSFGVMTPRERYASLGKAWPPADEEPDPVSGDGDPPDGGGEDAPR